LNSGGEFDIDDAADLASAILLRRISQMMAMAKPQRTARPPTAPPMMAPVLMVVPPLVDCEEDAVLLGVLDGPEFGVMEGPGVSVGCEPDAVVDGDVVEVEVVSSSTGGSVVKPMYVTTPSFSPQAKLVTASTSVWWLRIAVEQNSMPGTVLSSHRALAFSSGREEAA
jgi:hypothetical protein